VRGIFGHSHDGYPPPREDPGGLQARDAIQAHDDDRRSLALGLSRVIVSQDRRPLIGASARARKGSSERRSCARRS
jgi:hypothetical protein